MAKKKTEEKNSAQNETEADTTRQTKKKQSARKEPVKVRDIRKKWKILDRLMGELDLKLKRLEKAETEDIVIDGIGQIGRAINELKGYVANVATGISNADLQSRLDQD